jgi:hypothetical protein
MMEARYSRDVLLEAVLFGHFVVNFATVFLTVNLLRIYSPNETYLVVIIVMYFIISFEIFTELMPAIF